MGKKYCRIKQAIDGNIIRHMRTACGLTKAINTHSEYVTLIDFPRRQWFREAPQCCVIRTLLV